MVYLRPIVSLIHATLILAIQWLYMTPFRCAGFNLGRASVECTLSTLVHASFRVENDNNGLSLPMAHVYFQRRTYSSNRKLLHATTYEFQFMSYSPLQKLLFIMDSLLFPAPSGNLKEGSILSDLMSFEHVGALSQLNCIRNSDTFIDDEDTFSNQSCLEIQNAT